MILFNGQYHVPFQTSRGSKNANLYSNTFDKITPGEIQIKALLVGISGDHLLPYDTMTQFHCMVCE